MALTRTVAQAAGALTGNGTSVDVSGANCVIFALGVETAGTAGVYTFERSTDDGANWSALTCVKASDGNSVSASGAGQDGDAFVADDGLSGDVLVRARISTNWVTAAPGVIVIAQHGA